MNIEYPVLCPILGQLIDEGICFDIHMVVEHDAPKWTAPAAVYEKTDYETICFQCEFHRED